MSGFFLTMARTIRATCINTAARLSHSVSNTWRNCTFANIKRTICGVLRSCKNGFLFLVLSAWGMVCAALRNTRKTCTIANVRRAASATPGVALNCVKFAWCTIWGTPRFLLRIVCGTPRFLLHCCMFSLRACYNFGVLTLNYSRRNWKPLTLLLFSLTLLLIGFVRLHDYDVPMLKPDYQLAGKGKTEYNFEDKDGAPEPEFIQQDDWFQNSVVFVIHTKGLATDTVVGDRVTAKYNFALSLYHQDRYEEAVKAFNNAYRAMSDKNGQVKRGYEKRASETQLMIGNALCNSGKDGEAINAYQLSLTYDPNNLVTIYNLERLLSSGGGGGKDKGDKPKASNINKTKV
ncbi:MAG: tetratricopeptide repeat protein [Candidatus Melainabacteria bacterium]|nr:tetratricopeptide repeat protein [Candidatus Melainabacteria bacterium]